MRSLDTPARSRTDNGQVLVVDDEAAVRKIAAVILRTEGFSVSCCSSGEAALEEVSKTQGYDTVILDLEMPGMDGMTCLRNLRRLQPGLRVIISSGFIGSDHYRELNALGAAGVLLKPYRKADLLEQLESAGQNR